MKNFILLVFALSSFSFSWDQKCLKDLMLGYKIRTKSKKIFQKINKNPAFKLFTSEQQFKESGEFTAKYLNLSKTYPNADSIYFNLSYGSHLGLINVDKAKTLRVVTITEYLKNQDMVLPELERLKAKICSSYQFEYSPFTNGNGYIEVGINTDPIPYPALEMVPSTETDKVPNIEILIMDVAW